MGLVEDTLHEKMDRGVIPIQPNRDHPEGGTAFLFNHLIEVHSATQDYDRICRFLVTCGALVRGSEMAITTTPVAMVADPPASSDWVVWTEWSKRWHFSPSVVGDLAFHPASSVPCPKGPPKPGRWKHSGSHLDRKHATSDSSS